MKKILIIAALTFAAFSGKAQGNYNPFQDPTMIDNFGRIASVLLFVLILASFITTIIKMILDYRLKNKMIEKGVSETLASQFLTSSNKNIRETAIKWFAILVGAGMGLTLIVLFPPFGIHSLALMSFSIAIAFLGYSYYLKRSGK